MNTPPVIGFIGVGAMGAPMAANLIAAGFRVVVHDADATRAARVAEEVGATAASLADLAAEAGVVITMLPSSDIVEDVLVGDGRVLAHLAPGALVVDMSSSDPVRTRALAGQARKAGCRFIDAPVSGGMLRARKGDLAIMVSGDDADIEAAQPLLSAMGSRVTPVGDVGNAHAMKALNNLCSAGGMLIGLEVLMIGKRFGLNPELMVDVLNASTGMNNSTKLKFKQFVLSGAYDSNFRLDLMVKDLKTAQAVAAAGGAAAPFTDACVDLWEQALDSLGPDDDRGHDHTEIARYIEMINSTAYG
ncbi:NAD(P)-dependent oxidoreductase [Streptomyces sp. NPDC004838]